MRSSKRIEVFICGLIGWAFLGTGTVLAILYREPLVLLYLAIPWLLAMLFVRWKGEWPEWFLLLYEVGGLPTGAPPLKNSDDVDARSLWLSVAALSAFAIAVVLVSLAVLFGNTMLYVLAGVAGVGCCLCAIWSAIADWRSKQNIRRIKRGLCPKCAYPVGTWGGEVCTECGAAVPRSRLP